MFIDKSGIKTIMSNKQIEKLHYDLYDMKSPIFNFENALSTFTSLSANKADSFKNGLMDALQSVSWDYKSNNPRYLGKKIIMDDAVSVGKYSTRFNKTDTVNDLVRIFCILQKNQFTNFKIALGYIYLIMCELIIKILKLNFSSLSGTKKAQCIYYLKVKV